MPRYWLKEYWRWCNLLFTKARVRKRYSMPRIYIAEIDFQLIASAMRAKI